jgi:hypothetical protein
MLKVEEATTGIRNTLKNSEKIILQLEKYHSDKTVYFFQNGTIAGFQSHSTIGILKRNL